MEMIKLLGLERGLRDEEEWFQEERNHVTILLNRNAINFKPLGHSLGRQLSPRRKNMGKNRTRYIHPRLKLLPPPRCIIHRRFLHFIRHLVSSLAYFVRIPFMHLHIYTHIHTRARDLNYRITWKFFSLEILPVSDSVTRINSPVINSIFNNTI